jgi:putative phage-type endonuclease
MRSDLIRIEPLSHRSEHIGGSEIAIIQGLSKYKSAHQLFYEKVERTEEPVENIPAFMGKYHEDSIARLWTYWENDQETMMKNFNEDKQVRKCRRVNATLINPKYLHLAATIDRCINKNGNGQEGILEIKDMSGYATKIWVGEIPPQHLVQLQHYLLVTELEYGELFIQVDGRWLNLYEFKRNDDIIAGIIEQSEIFWNTVLEARELLAKGLPFEHLEPSIENIEAYKNYLDAKYLAQADKAEATEEMKQLGLDYMQCNEEKNIIEEKKTELTNRIKEHMKEAELIDFGSEGKITWKADKNGKRTMRIDMKQPAEINKAA